MRIIDFLSPKVALFVNSQIGAFAFAKISCSNKLAAMSAVHFFGVSCLLSELVHMYMYIII